MPRKAFLKKKSLLDRFKDDYATHTGYIQSARAKHTWNNPLTRRKRTKELNKWIKSFAGKDHIHKLARFNAINAGKNEDYADGVKCLRYGSSFELPDGKIIIALDKAIRCRRSGAFIVYITGWVENEENDSCNSKYIVYFDTGKYEDYFLTNDIQDLPNYQTNGPIPSDNKVVKDYAMHENTNEAMSLKGFLENLTEKLTKQFDLDLEEVQAYLNSHTQEMQELLNDKELSLKEKVLFVRSEITGEQDEKKSEKLVVSNPCVVYKGDAENAAKAHDYLYKKMPRVKGASISSDVKPLGNNKFCRVLFYGSNTGVSALFGYYSNLYNDDFWNNCDADPQGWVNPLTINKYDVATPRQESKKSEFYMDGDDSEDYYYCHKCGRVTPSYELDAHGGFCSDCDARWTAEHENESKDTDEKLGYEKGHKNSKGEDAPWVIRSHEDNRVLASFANKKDAEEHLQRMKQYSKTESKNESNKNDVEQEIIRIFEKLSKENKSISQFIDMEEIKDNIEELREIFWDKWADDNFENGHFVWHIDANREDEEEADMWNGIATFITDEVLELLDIPNDGKPSQNWIDLQEYLFYEVFEKVYDYSDDEDGSADETKKSESLTQDEEHEWFTYWANRIRDRLANYPGKSGFIQENCKMLPYSDVRQMWGVAAMAQELCDKYARYLSFRSYTNRNGSPFVEISWTADDADALAKALGPKVESKKSEAHDLKNYTSNIISKLDGIWACGLNGAKRLAEKYVDVIQQNYTDGDLSAAETAKFIAGQENLTESRKKTESKQSEVHLELIDTIIVPKWLWEAHSFGNEYGEDLDEHEQEILAKFEEEYGKQYYLDDRSEEADFRSRNDFDEYGGPCYEVDVYKMS